MKLLTGTTLAIATLSLSSSVVAASESISSLGQLPFDENDKLATHVLVHPDGECSTLIENYFVQKSPDGYQLQSMAGDAKDSFFGNVAPSTVSSIEDCRAICVERGVDRSLVTNAIPARHFNRQEQSFNNWFSNNCQKVEIGFMNYLNPDTTLKLSWLNPMTGRWENNWRPIAYGEKGTLCIDSFIGHIFKFEDFKTKEVVKMYTVEFTSMISIGEAPPYTRDTNRDYETEIQRTLDYEWAKHNKITRTFSQLGFQKGRLPDDLFASMGAFYYNNRNHRVREEWTGKGLFVNWWETDVLFIQIPWKLKEMWQYRLKALVEEWVGVDLEQTSMYGLRQYESGARLLTHVDRQTTHAASLIVNVAQGNLDEPWTVEVHDHADRLHQVTMNPGDVVYYESARCLHGRNTPLKGDGAYYVNLFTHYRPTGDSKWYTKENAEHTPEPLLDVGECRLEAPPQVGVGAVKCDNPGVGQYLSPSMFTATSGRDLFEWWRSVGPDHKNEPNVTTGSSEEL